MHLFPLHDVLKRVPHMQLGIHVHRQRALPQDRSALPAPLTRDAQAAEGRGVAVGRPTSANQLLHSNPCERKAIARVDFRTLPLRDALSQGGEFRLLFSWRSISL